LVATLRRPTWKNVVFDIETDGFLDKLTKTHSLVIKDLDTRTKFSCTNADPNYPSIEAGLLILSNAERAYGHNVVSFDLPAIQKVYPKFQLKGRLLDTYLAASVRWAHIRELDFPLWKSGQLPGALIGSHSLKAWGYRLGIRKGTYTEETEDAFDTWSPELQGYCEQDVDVTEALVLKIKKAGALPAETIETEHELAAYLACQEANGWPFDLEKAQALQARLSARRQELHVQLVEAFPPWQKSLGMFTPKVNSKKHGYVKGVPVERFKTIEFNPGSRDHIVNRMSTLYGWQPTEFTDSGKPALDENTFKGLDYPHVKELQEYLLVEKRLGQISEGKEAWLRHAKPHPVTGLHHIHHRCIQNRAVTHRAGHSNPNIAQVPKVGSPYGEECRELFMVPPGWVQIGADASGLELRCLAHEMGKWDDGEYGKTVLADKPNDIHTINATILGVPRDTAKTFIYALLYGAGDEKLGKIISPGLPPAKLKKLGAATRAKFFKGLPALEALSKEISRQTDKNGFLVLIDGRRVYIRSEHAALNSKLQGNGAIICKRWIVEFNRRLTARFGPQGWGGKWAALGWIHDEVQIAVRPEIADEVCQILIDSIRHMTQHYKFRLPLDGEAKVGKNWKECH
jgi:DNA polymerase-1